MSRGRAPRTVAVVGGGHNALVAAVRLARAGVEVTVLERGEEAGGCLWTETTGDGVVVERGAWEHSGVRDVADGLGLAEHGLTYEDHPMLAGFTFGDGTQRLFHADRDETLAGLRSDGLTSDAAAYAELAETAGTLFGMLDAFGTPPTMTQVASALSSLRGGDALFRTLTSSAQTVLETRLADPYLRTALGLYASHAQVPVWAPGSGMFAFLLPGSHGSRPARPVGGSRALADALVSALTAAGGVVRTGAEVVGLASDGDGALVTLADGSQLSVDAVVSSVDLARTVSWLDDAAPATRAAAHGLHSGQLNVCELTVSVVTSKAPAVPALAADPRAVWFAIDRHEDLGHSFGHVLAGQVPERPWAMVGQVAQPDGVAGGALWLSSVVPVRRADGAWTPALEQAAGERVLDHVSATLGVDLHADAVEVRVSGPSTWSGRIGGDGNPNHVDNTFDQLLGWRPPGLPGIRRELPWLQLCGAGTNPGGGLSGASGVAAAEALLSVGPTRPVSRLGDEVRGLTRAFAAYRSMRKGA